MALIYNGTEINKVIYNGTELTSLIYNGTEIFNQERTYIYKARAARVGTTALSTPDSTGKFSASGKAFMLCFSNVQRFYCIDHPLLIGQKGRGRITLINAD